jgi:hypothetical protein
MANPGVIRPLIGGGCSICRAAEENIGKRKCKHILDNASIIYVEKDKGTNFINIEGRVDGKNASFSVEASDKKIKEYIINLSSGLSKKEKATILAVLQDE